MIVLDFGRSFLSKCYILLTICKSCCTLIQSIKIIRNFPIFSFTISRCIIIAKVRFCTFKFEQFAILLIYHNSERCLIQNIVIQTFIRGIINEFNSRGMRNCSNLSRLKCSFNHIFNDLISLFCFISIFIQTFQI